MNSTHTDGLIQPADDKAQAVTNVAGSSAQGQRRVTVAALAYHKRLPVDFLGGLGLSDLPDGGVAMPYFDESGQQLFVRERESPRQARFWQPKGVPLRAYGEWKLHEAQKAGVLALVEGESDCWALWHHGFPALGIPGASTVKVLTAEHLVGVDKLYVHREPDKGGEQFVKGVIDRLKKLDYQSRAFELRMPDDIKDPADLHVADPERFSERLQAAIRQSVELPLSEPEESAQANLFHHSDTGNAKRFAAKHAGDVRYCWPWNTYLIFDGQRFKRDDSGEIDRLAKATITDLHDKAKKLQDDARQALIKHALKSENAPRIDAMVKLARSESGIPIKPDEFDTDPMLLNVLNGALDLRTGELREHRREDKLTKLAPVEYHKDADCPTWLRFLHTIFAHNADLIAYVQRLLGCCLTGDASEQMLNLFYGTGANGKSVWLNTALALLGPDYAMKASPDLLIVKRNNAHPTERADLFGKRLVVVSETEDGQRLAESLMKDMTGGDRMRARHCHKDNFEFAPTYKIILATNHKPEVRDTGHGTWRRIKVIPFKVTIPDGKQDKHLFDKLRAELSGILAWTVQGCLLWQRDGLEPPREVDVETDDYRREQDVLRGFIEECCIIGSEHRCRGPDLRDAFEKWSDQKGIAPRTFNKAVREYMAANSYELKEYKDNGLCFRGIGLRSGTEQRNERNENQ